MGGPGSGRKKGSKNKKGGRNSKAFVKRSIKTGHYVPAMKKNKNGTLEPTMEWKTWK
jgi:hypothetical protein